MDERNEQNKGKTKRKRKSQRMSEIGERKKEKIESGEHDTKYIEKHPQKHIRSRKIIKFE